MATRQKVASKKATQSKKLNTATKRLSKFRSIFNRTKKQPAKSRARTKISFWKRAQSRAKSSLAKLTTLLKKLRPRRPDFNGYPSNVSRAVKRCIVRGNEKHLYVTSTTGGTHSPTSWHYSGKAVDMASSRDNMIAFQRSEAKRGAHKYNELFGPDSFYIKNGVVYDGAFPDHQDHVHIAPR